MHLVTAAKFTLEIFHQERLQRTLVKVFLATKYKCMIAKDFPFG